MFRTLGNVANLQLDEMTKRTKIKKVELWF